MYFTDIGHDADRRDRNITKQREIEQTREAITETVVHDLRSPMSAIVGALVGKGIHEDNMFRFFIAGNPGGDKLP